MAQSSDNRPNKKEYSELIFAVQWKTRFINGVETANSIFSMCDYPATTSKWENFKEYLLTHSGVPPRGDIRVHYVTFEGTEACIDSQEAFEKALTMFRTVSQQNKIINITVEMLAGARKKNLQITFKNEPAKKEAQVGTTTAPQDHADPPQWFLTYMAKFKEDIVNQVHSEIRNMVDVINKSQVVVQPKVKSDVRSEYKARKNVLLAEASKEKELHKYERKLEKLAEASKEKELHKYERKLEKIGAKSKKDSKKKHKFQGMTKLFQSALIDRLVILNTDPNQLSNEARQPSQDKGPPNEELLVLDGTENDASIDISIIESDMDARAVSVDAPDTMSVRVCLGEKLYVHRWRVYNKGKLTWDNNTELRHTWGSTRFLPVEKVIKLPHLAPNESQLVNVAFHVPVEPGIYECYWHFHQQGIRFGHWISCCITVMDPIPSRSSNLGNKITMSEKTEESRTEPTKENATSYIGGDFNGMKCISYGFNNLHLSDEEDYKSSDSAYSVCGGNSSLDERDYCVLSIPDPLHSNNTSEVQASLEKVDKLPELLEVTANDAKKELSSPSKNHSGVYGLSEDIIISKEEFEGEGEEFQANKEAADESVSDGGESFVKVDCSIPVELPKNEEVNGNEDTAFQTKDTMEGYAYVTFNSKKVAVPKRFLRADFLQTAEAAPGPERLEVNNNQSNPLNITQASASEVKPSNVEATSGENSQTPLELSKHIEITRQPLFYSEEIKVAKAGPNLTESIPKAESKSVRVKVKVNGHKLTNTDSNTMYYRIPTEHEALGSTYRAYMSSPCNSVPDLINPQNLSTLGNEKSKREDPMAPKNSPVYPHMAEPAWSYCSATGSNFSDSRPCMTDSTQSNSRLFVFPQNYPGYEVIDPAEFQFDHVSSSVNGIVTSVQNGASTFQSPVPHPSLCSAGSHCTAYTRPPLFHCRSPILEYTSGHYQFVSPTTSQNHQSTYVGPITAEQHNYGAQNASVVYPDLSAFRETTVIPDYPVVSYEVMNGYNSTRASLASEQGPKNHPESALSAVHTLPETFVAGAVNVASSAINRAKSVYNMIKPKHEPGRWENGHWLSADPGTARENNLLILKDMGFTNRDLNATLLARYNDDLSRVIAELLN